MSIVRASKDTKQKNRGYKESGSYYDVNSGRDPRAKRITPGSSMKTSMIAEMVRINALNLEPSLPKLDDKTWANCWRQRRHVNKTVEGDRKAEFLQSLEVINKRQAGKGQQQHKRQQLPQDAQASGSSSDQATKSTAGSSSEQHKWQ